MAWIESHTLLLRHRKLVELAKALRLKPVHCLGHLHALWHAAMEQAEDGDLSSWSDEFIAESASYQGDAPQFVSLLELHGWLNGKKIHDWLDYAGRFLHGKYSSNRTRLVEIWAKHGRVYGETAKLPPSNRQVTAKFPPTTLPDLTEPNLTIPKEKPRRVKSVCDESHTSDNPRRFQRPSIEDVREFIRSKNYDVDPEKWFAHYESNGWIVGRVPMRNWQAAVRTWVGRNYGGSNAGKNSFGPSGGSFTAPREDRSKFDGIGTVVQV